VVSLGRRGKRRVARFPSEQDEEAEMSKRIISRRVILGLSATAGISAVLAACGATPTPQVIEKVVEREVTKIVEGTPQVVVETVVVQETVVVKETVQVAAPTAAAQGPIVLKMLWRITNPQEEPAMNALWLSAWHLFGTSILAGRLAGA
jgi:hypothetical protein